jgi:hypothetical protein
VSTCSAMATRLDEEMLSFRPAHVHPAHTALHAMPARTGAAVSAELGGRYLLRYLMRRQYGQFTTGSPNVNFTTPTPYSPAETISWLALPNPTRRDFVLFLDPNSMPEVRGPRRVLLGGGIEYILSKGFPVSALVVSWPILVV